LKALLQRVIKASVKIHDEIVGEIGPGLVVFIGIAHEDSEVDINYLADKIANLRIFSDEAGRFNLSAIDTGGDLLVVSQFTLLAETLKGRRPSFIGAASPERAEYFFELFIKRIRETGLRVETGRFQQHMLVEICNDGPVTIILDSREKLFKY